MSSFKWRDYTNSYYTFDPMSGDERCVESTDREVINDLNSVSFGDTLKALARVVSELVEIEENRAAQQNEPSSASYRAVLARASKQLKRGKK